MHANMDRPEKDRFSEAFQFRAFAMICRRLSPGTPARGEDVRPDLPHVVGNGSHVSA